MGFKEVREQVEQALDKDPTLCPLLIRFTWHCCGTFDIEKGNGGSNGGTMRFHTERNDPENKGFKRAFELFEKIKSENEEISYADLYVIGGYVAIEWSGGPKIPFKFGRKDFSHQECVEIYGDIGCPFGDGKINPSGSRLPSADLGFSEETRNSKDRKIKEKKTIDGVRNTFKRLGMDGKETVALLLLGHQFGQAKLENSGYDGFWYAFGPNTWNIAKKQTFGGYMAVYRNLHRFAESWTIKGKRQFESMVYGHKFMMLPADMAIYWDDDYKTILQHYDKNRKSFFKVATQTWIKLTEAGCNNLKPELLE